MYVSPDCKQSGATCTRITPPVSDPMPSGRRVVSRTDHDHSLRTVRQCLAARAAEPVLPGDAQAVRPSQLAGLPGADTGQRGHRHRHGCLPASTRGRRAGPRRDVDPQSLRPARFGSARTGSTVLRRSGIRGPATSDLAKGGTSVARRDGVGKRPGLILGKSLGLLAAGAGFVHGCAVPRVRSFCALGSRNGSQGRGPGMTKWGEVSPSAQLRSCLKPMSPVMAPSFRRPGSLPPSSSSAPEPRIHSVMLDCGRMALRYAGPPHQQNLRFSLRLSPRFCILSHQGRGEAAAVFSSPPCGRGRKITILASAKS